MISYGIFVIYFGDQNVSQISIKVSKLMLIVIFKYLDILITKRRSVFKEVLIGTKRLTNIIDLTVDEFCCYWATLADCQSKASNRPNSSVVPIFHPTITLEQNKMVRKEFKERNCGWPVVLNLLFQLSHMSFNLTYHLKSVWKVSKLLKLLRVVTANPPRGLARGAQANLSPLPF